MQELRNNSLRSGVYGGSAEKTSVIVLVRRPSSSLGSPPYTGCVYTGASASHSLQVGQDPDLLWRRQEQLANCVIGIVRGSGSGWCLTARWLTDFDSGLPGFLYFFLRELQNVQIFHSLYLRWVSVGHLLLDLDSSLNPRRLISISIHVWAGWGHSLFSVFCKLPKNLSCSGELTLDWDGTRYLRFHLR